MIRTYQVDAPITDMVWNVHIAADGVVARNAPLVDVVDCANAFVEATVSERRDNDVQPGERVDVKLFGSNHTIGGTIQEVRGHSPVVNRDSQAAWYTSHRNREAMTVSVALDPEALQQVSKGVCQIGRSAKVYFDHKQVNTSGSARLPSIIGLVSSAYAAVAPVSH